MVVRTLKLVSVLGLAMMLAPAFGAATISPITDVTVAEDAASQVVGFNGVGGNAPLSVSAVSNNTALIPNPTVNYANPNTNGSLTIQSVLHQIGTAKITVTVTENGGGTASTSFNVTVSPNSAPTLATINDVTVPEDAVVPRQIVVTGIAADAAAQETRQVLSVSALVTATNNANLLPAGSVTVSYTSPSATATINVSPALHQIGQATISVTVTDDGGTAGGGVNSITKTFNITVLPNSAPTLNTIPDLTIPEDTGQQTVGLSGIKPDASNLELRQSLAVTATSNNQAVIQDSDIHITYFNPNQTATLTFTSLLHGVGVATISVTVTDDGGTASLGSNSVTQTFKVTVSPNQPPTLTAISDATIPEDAVMQQVTLQGIKTDATQMETRQNLTVTATSNNQALIRNQDISIVYTSPSPTGTLTYISLLHATGQAIISVTVTDDGGTFGGGVNSVTQTFTVTVSPNLTPTLNVIASVTIPEDAVMQTVNLSGIKADATPVAVRQNLTVTATSSDQTIIRDQDITVTYASPSQNGSLTYISLLHATGTATIFVTVTDDGGTAGGGVNSVTQSFQVTVMGNQAPTLAVIQNITVPEDSLQHTVNLTGIHTDAGPFEVRQSLTVTATSSDQSIIKDSDILVNYASPNIGGSLTFITVLHGSGLVVISVKVQDDGGLANGGTDSFTRTFQVSVTQNQPPTLTAIPDATIPEDTFTQSVSLSGIQTDALQNEVRQSLTVTATSNNQAVIRDSDISITYISPNATATLNYITVLHASGSAMISVKVMDDGGTGNGGVNFVIKSFTVTVLPDAAPTLSAIPDPAPINENAPQQTVNFGGINTDAPQQEIRQSMAVTATSDNQVVIPNANITIQYVSPGATGKVMYTPAPHTNGTVNITVKVQDDGTTANGGIDTVTRTFKVVVNQVYEAPLVTDGPKTVNDPLNLRPAAGMLPNYVALTGAPVSLQVTVFSYDIDGVLNGLVNGVSTRDTLRFDWSATLNGQPTNNATFVPNHDVPADPVTGSSVTKMTAVTFSQAGIYTVVLTVSGVAGAPATAGADSVTVSTLVIPVNTPPVINSVQLPANQNPVLSVNEDVVLTAYSTVNGDPALTPAFDPDGDSLLYSWAFKRTDDPNDDDYVEFTTTTTNTMTFNTGNSIFTPAYNGQDQVNLTIQCVITDLPTRGVNAAYTSTPPSKPAVKYVLTGYPVEYRSDPTTRTVSFTLQSPNNDVRSKLSTVVRNPINKVTLFSLGGRGIFQVDARYVESSQLKFSGDGVAADANALTLSLNPDPTQTPLPDGTLPGTVGVIEGLLAPLYPLVKLTPPPNPNSRWFNNDNVNPARSDLLHNPFTISLISRGDLTNTKAEGVSLITVRDETQSDPHNRVIVRRMIPITTVESQTAEGPTTVPVPGDYTNTFISGRFGFTDGVRDLVSFRGSVGPVNNPLLDISGDPTKPNKISVGLGNVIVEGTFVFQGSNTAKVHLTNIYDDGDHKPLTKKDVSIFRVQLQNNILLVNLALSGDNLAARGFDTAGVTNHPKDRFGVDPPPNFGTVQKGNLTQLFIQAAVVVGQQGKLNNNYDSIIRCFYFLKNGTGRIVGQNFKQ